MTVTSDTAAAILIIFNGFDHFDAVIRTETVSKVILPEAHASVPESLEVHAAARPPSTEAPWSSAKMETLSSLSLSVKAHVTMTAAEHRDALRGKLLDECADTCAELYAGNEDTDEDDEVTDSKVLLSEKGGLQMHT